MLRRLAAGSGLVLLAGIAFVLMASRSAGAYDAGYHWDLTRDALAGQGFGADATALVEVNNFYPDAFASADEVIADRWVRTLRLDHDWDALFGPASLRQASDTYLHFSDLGSTAEVTAGWDRLARNTYRAAKLAEGRNDPRAFLVVLGTSLHAVQDFYAHANWSALEFDPAIGDPTWFDVPVAERGRADVYTTARTPQETLGKDDAGAPGFARSYREAYYASAQWARLVRSWVGESFGKAASRVAAPEVAEERDFLRSLAWYGGHWKGLSSQGYVDLAAVGVKYLRHADRAGIAEWAAYAPSLTGEPDAGPAPVASPAKVARVDWLEVRFTRVRETDEDLVWTIDPFGSPDFYAKVTVGDREYLEARYVDKKDVSPASWLTLVPLAPETDRVTVKVALWDEDVAGGGVLPSLRGKDDLCDILPALGARVWSADITLADLPEAGRAVGTDGVRPDHAKRASHGDGKEVAVEFTIRLVEPED
jgi:hypothetical protein